MEISLVYLQVGRRAKIKRIMGGMEFQRKLALLNIRIGKGVKKITQQPFSGPVVIEIDNTRVTLGRGMANRVIVELIE
jgi:ferrous iron transport protein A